MKVFEYLVVGSGCSGSMAAQTLVEAGKEVVMVDVGAHDDTYAAAVPDKDFISLRKTDPEQYRYLIGDQAEGVSVGELGKGAQITPTRHHMLQYVDSHIPLQSSTFSPLESLGYGGLGIGWGLQCWEFSPTDLKRTGLAVERMAGAYETVSKRIGISATNDAAGPYTLGSLKSYQPSAHMDRNHARLFRNYQRRAKAFKQRGFYVGRTPLALITESLNGRQPYAYHDMDFYTDNRLSAWRPWITVDALRKKSNFTYIGNRLVTSFSEHEGIVTVHCLDVATNKTSQLQCKRLILASGALGSARIVLRSLGTKESRLPLLCNPHSYIPYLQPSLVGQSAEANKLGFGELSYFIDPVGKDDGLSVASSYGYQSLMLFRLVNQAPFDLNSARIIMGYLMSGLVIMIAQHPDSPSAEKYVRLVDNADSPTGDMLEAHYVLKPEEEAEWDRREKQYVTAMRKLRAYAIRRVKTPHGSSIHYAGTIPFSNVDKPLTLSPSGRLYGTEHVYVADSSGFTYLPAKGLTFSLMANAHITAENALHGTQ
jgi:choline dehydrogenase-like flavoprotein